MNLVSIANPVDPQPGENIWHLLAAVGTEVDQLSVSQSSCCAETFTALNAIESTIDSLATAGCDLSGTFTALATLTNQVITIESKVENLSAVIVSNFSSTFTALAVSGYSLSDTFTLIDAANQIEFTTQSKLDLCCSKIETLFSISQLCESIPLDQSNVVAGTITLDVAGRNYCLNQTVTGNILITASDISLNFNDHNLNGSITIASTAPRTTISNGKMFPSSPTNATQAANGALFIQAANAQILNMYIECPDTGSTASTINGLTGIQITSTDASIKKCVIKAGKGNNALSSTAGIGGVGVNAANNVTIYESVIYGGNGGNGIVGFISGSAGGVGVSLGLNSFVSESQIFGGNGGNGADNTSGGNAGSGGNGGIAITSSQQNITTQKSIIRGGTGGNSGTAASATSVAASGGTGGVGITFTQAFCTVDSCSISSGNGGQGLPGTIANAAGGNGGASGTCVNISGTNFAIINNHISSGTPGSGGAGQAPLSLQGNGGSSGIGITINTNNGIIKNNFTVTSNGINATTPISGIAGNGGSSGFGITISGNQIEILNNTIRTGNGGNASNGITVAGAGNGGVANSGLSMSGQFITILNNVISTGNTGTPGVPAPTSTTAPAGASSGDAIIGLMLNVAINNNVLSTGNASDGASSANVTAGGIGGNGGHGVNISANSNNAIISNNIIASIGRGGNGGTGSSTTGNGGNSGHGILTATTARRTQISFNNISNTQIGGTGAANGTNGFAILDQANTVGTSSAIFGNFASDIANATPYTISPQSMATSTPSVGIASSTNKLNNVHAP
jgi:hypothetical protein